MLCRNYQSEPYRRIKIIRHSFLPSYLKAIIGVGDIRKGSNNLIMLITFSLLRDKVMAEGLFMQKTSRCSMFSPIRTSKMWFSLPLAKEEAKKSQRSLYDSGQKHDEQTSWNLLDTKTRNSFESARHEIERFLRLKCAAAESKITKKFDKTKRNLFEILSSSAHIINKLTRWILGRRGPT